MPITLAPAPEDADDRSGTRRGAAKGTHDPDNAPVVGPDRGMPEKGADSAEKVGAGVGAAGREALPDLPPVVASGRARDGELNASVFKAAVARQWGMSLNYEVHDLPLLEQLLLAALREKPRGGGGQPPVSEALVRCLGCYVGETLRRHAPARGSWHEAEDWGTDAVLL